MIRPTGTNTLPWLLLIEDSNGDALLLKTAFTIAGVAVNVGVAVNGEDALRWLEKLAHSEPALHPDLIVLDLNLPLVSGFELLEFLAGESRLRVPVIVLTTSAHGSERCTQFGVADYLVKPSNFDGYLEIAKRLGQALPHAA